MTLTPGIVLNDRYTIDSILGQGGMGAVYRAHDANLGIFVAVKENLFLSDEYARQFQREASILASLRHINLPRVIDYFAIPGQGQYLIMDFIEGEDLRQRIERTGTITEKEAILIGVAICDALDYLHTRKPPVVHRDLKPGNIKITPEGEIVLVDFGLAKIMRDSQATTTGARAMTPGYSPPEQYGTARTDSRTDIYSLGATIYAALTGVIPEDGLARATGKAQLTGIRELQPNIDRRLAAVIEKSLEIEPDQRYQGVLEFQTALLRAGDISPTSRPNFRISPPPTEPAKDELEEAPLDVDVEAAIRPSSKSRRKKRMGIVRRLVTALIMFVVLFGVFGSVYFFRPNLPEAIVRLLPNPASPAQAIVADPAIPATHTPNPPTPSPTLEPSATQAIVVPQPTSTTAPTRTLSPTPQQTPLGGGNGLISLVSDRSGSFQIWSIAMDGTRARQISNLPDGACQPAWAPDGTRLAVVSPCRQKDFTYPDAKIYIMNADGSDAHPLSVSVPGDFDPAWSPDGRRLAFSSLRTGTSHIFVFNFDNLTLEELSDTRFSDSQPAWSPDGKQLAFSRLDVFHHIFIMSDRGQTQYQFSSSGNVNDYWPVWSSNGEFIMFGRSQVTTMIPWLLKLRIDDRGKAADVRIPPFGVGESGPIWEADLSPDMNWIAYEGWPDGNNHDIFLMDSKGENRQRLTTDPGFDFNPVWIPR